MNIKMFSLFEQLCLLLLRQQRETRDPRNDVSGDGAVQTKRHLSAQGDLALCVICHSDVDVVCVCVCVFIRCTLPNRQKHRRFFHAEALASVRIIFEEHLAFQKSLPHFLLAAKGTATVTAENVVVSCLLVNNSWMLMLLVAKNKKSNERIDSQIVG